MTRILFLTITSEVGGSDLTILRVIRNLDKDRFQTFMVFPKDGPLVPEFEKAGCQPRFIKMMKLRNTRNPLYFLLFFLRFMPTVLALRKIIKEEGIDIVHTNTMHNVYGWAAALLTRRPHIWHIREIPSKPKIVKWIELFLVEHFSTKIVVMSEPIRELLAEKGKYSLKVAPRIVKVYDGVDLEEFDSRISGKRIRSELGIWDGEPLVGMVCRLDPWKGVDVFIKAAALVLKKLPGAKFLIAGGTIEGREYHEAELHALAKELGVQEQVIFTGWTYRCKDVPEVYRALDVHVHASKLPEPYGLTNLEAMACGTPLIATNMGGPAELVEDNVSGLLVPPDDPETLADAIISLLENTLLSERIRREGRKRAEALFDLRKSVKLYERLYEEIDTN